MYKNKSVCLIEVTWLVTMKMRLKMKNRSHSYNINRPRPRRGRRYSKYKNMSQHNDVYMY